MKTITPLAKIPKPPEGVKYALTVPQSVLFADLSLQGNRREFFRTAMHIDYELGYVVKDAGGVMSWNYDSDETFYKALIGDGKPLDGINRFIAAMGITSRKLLRRSELGSDELRRPAQIEDLVQDLANYWQAYKLHMTCLFSFWNVEHILSNLMTSELKRAGMYTGTADVERFVKPAETNQFARERRSFERLVRRFGDKTDEPSPELMAALSQHAHYFAFLSAPFNVTDTVSAESLLPRVAETRKVLNEQPKTTENEAESFNDLPSAIRDLALAAQNLTFWKNERIDVMSLADAMVAPIYQAAANVLDLSLTDLFTMTTGEIQSSLLKGKTVVDRNTLADRQQAFCLVLHKGQIDFYQPTIADSKTGFDNEVEESFEFQGVVASTGKVSGKARIINFEKDLQNLKTGEILVTTMTRPEYGAALDRAAAFVTDEGGIMCHAAIIAREMSKPCIIATDKATKILKTGMMITVDADEGKIVVNKLA